MNTKSFGERIAQDEIAFYENKAIIRRMINKPVNECLITHLLAIFLKVISQPLLFILL